MSLLQDLENIASVFTNKTWKTGGLSGATKSMFKTRVKFTKKERPQKPAQLLPAVQEAGHAPPAELRTQAAPSEGSCLTTPTGGSEAAQLNSGSRRALLDGAGEPSSAAQF